VLDACALIAYLNDEEGAEQVQMRLDEAVEQRVLYSDGQRAEGCGGIMDYYLDASA